MDAKTLVDVVAWLDAPAMQALDSQEIELDSETLEILEALAELTPAGARALGVL